MSENLYPCIWFDSKAAEAADTGLAVIPICAAVTLMLSARSGRILFLIATSAMIGNIE